MGRKMLFTDREIVEAMVRLNDLGIDPSEHQLKDHEGVQVEKERLYRLRSRAIATGLIVLKPGTKIRTHRPGALYAEVVQLANEMIQDGKRPTITNAKLSGWRGESGKWLMHLENAIDRGDVVLPMWCESDVDPDWSLLRRNPPDIETPGVYPKPTTWSPGCGNGVDRLAHWPPGRLRMSRRRFVAMERNLFCFGQILAEGMKRTEEEQCRATESAA